MLGFNRYNSRRLRLIRSRFSWFHLIFISLALSGLSLAHFLEFSRFLSLVRALHALVNSFARSLLAERHFALEILLAMILSLQHEKIWIVPILWLILVIDRRILAILKIVIFRDFLVIRYPELARS